MGACVGATRQFTPLLTLQSRMPSAPSAPLERDAAVSTLFHLEDVVGDEEAKVLQRRFCTKGSEVHTWRVSDEI